MNCLDFVLTCSLISLLNEWVDDMRILKQLNYYVTHNHRKYVHAIKYMLAFSLGYLAMLIFKGAYSLWILITIAVVMSSQPVVGLLLQKSVLRIIGTIVGLLFRMLTFVIPQNPFTIFIFVSIVSFVMALSFANRSEEMGQVGVLGMVTFCLITFIAKGDVHFALMRLLDTFIGIIISFVVSFFFFPMTTKRSVTITLSSTCRDLESFIKSVFIEGKDRRFEPNINALENRIIQDLTKLRNIIRSRKYETLWGSAMHKAQMNIFIRYLRAIYHYLLFVDVALAEIAEKNAEFSAEIRGALLPRWNKLSEIFSEATLDKPSFSRRMYYKPLDESVFTEQFKPQFYTIDFAMRRIPFCLKKMEVARRMLQL